MMLLGATQPLRGDEGAEKLLCFLSLENTSQLTEFLRANLDDSQFPFFVTKFSFYFHSMDEKRQISWRMLPRKPAKQLRNTLQKYFKEVKECPREDSIGFTSLVDPDMNRSEKYRHLELDIQV